MIGPAPTPQTDPEPDTAAADAAAAFMAMLRRVHELSGLTAGQIAVSSGLPRSTAYRFIDRSNRALPKKRDQLEAFLRACRLPKETLNHMLTLWDELTGNPTSNPDIAAEVQVWEEGDQDLPVPPAKVSEQIWNGFQNDPPRKPAIEGVIDIGYLDVDLTSLNNYVARSRRTGHGAGMCLHPGHCRDCLGLGTTPAPQRQRRRPLSAVQGAVTRAFPVILLVIALYPMAVTIRFGHLFTSKTASMIAASTITIGLLFGTSKWVHKPYWPELLTRGRLVTASVTGLVVGGLAWLAVPVPLVGVLTGFIVFTATPLWIGLTKRSDILTSARGLFILIASVWCGTVLGVVTTLADFPLLGSVLAGLLGTAMAAMLLSNNLLDNRPDAETTDPATKFRPRVSRRERPSCTEDRVEVLYHR